MQKPCGNLHYIISKKHCNMKRSTQRHNGLFTPVVCSIINILSRFDPLEGPTQVYLSLTLFLLLPYHSKALDIDTHIFCLLSPSIHRSSFPFFCRYIVCLTQLSAFLTLDRIFCVLSSVVVAFASILSSGESSQPFHRIVFESHGFHCLQILRTGYFI